MTFKYQLFLFLTIPLRAGIALLIGIHWFLENLVTAEYVEYGRDPIDFILNG